MVRLEEVTSNKSKLKKNRSFSGIVSEKPMKISRKSLGAVLVHPAKRKLEDSIFFLKSPKSKRKEISDDKTPQIQKSRKTQIETSSSFTEKYNIKIEDIRNTIKGIIKYRETNPKLKNQLFDEQVPLFLNINVHKIPKGHPKLMRIPLRNTTYGPDDEICLIVPDVKGIKNAEHEKHVEHYEKLLHSKGVANIKKIMTFHELRTEYETFELRSRLVDTYDIFLVDGRISGKVVAKCGKPFYKKHKVPTSVKLHVTNLQDHINKALSKTIMNLHLKSAGYSIQFGHTKMKSDELIENLISVVEFLNSNFPGNFANIKSIYMFAPRSTSFPVYVSLESPCTLKVPTIKAKKPKAYKTYTGELTTQLNTEVTVQPSGKVILRKVQDESEGELPVNMKTVEKFSPEKVKNHKDIKIDDKNSGTTKLTAEKKKSKRVKPKSEQFVEGEVMESCTQKQENKNHRKNKTVDGEKKLKKPKQTKIEKVASTEILPSSGAQNILENPMKRKMVVSTKVFKSKSVDDNVEQTELTTEKPRKRTRAIQVGEWTITEDDGENPPGNSKKIKNKRSAAV